MGSDGTVTFDDLELGLYLIVQTTGSGRYKTISPFVVTVPIDNNGVWDYTVDASPKVSVELDDDDGGGGDEPDEPDEPDDDDEPDEPEDDDDDGDGGDDGDDGDGGEPDIPQTGQLNWPVPLLAVCGLLLFALGWVLKCGKKESR